MSQLNETQIIEEKEKDPFEIENENLLSKPSINKQLSMQNENLHAEIHKLKEKVKWFEDAINKKDKLNEETHKENDTLKKEISQLKELLLNETNAQKKLTLELSESKIALNSFIKEKETLLKDFKLLEDLMKKKEVEFLKEKGDLLSVKEELNSSKQVNDGFDKALEKKEPEKKEKEISSKNDEFFLNPIMKIVLYMLLAVYISFYIAVDRVKSLLPKK